MSNELEKQLVEAEKLLAETADVEIKNLALQEISSLKRQLDLINPINQRNAIIEIRSGTGGDEAELFAKDLFTMYQKFSEKKGWSIEIIDLNTSDLNGIKSVVFIIKNPQAYASLRFEGGVHRVQRVPKTEKSGRIHTSAASVVVLPETKEIDIQLNFAEIRIDTYRAGGHGGQSVNTTDSAIRLTHLPTGIVVTCQDERSQLKNKEKALNVLRSRLWDLEQSKVEGKNSTTRKEMIKTGDRSDKIRTYNFPQNRITDHRVGRSWHNLEAILSGELDSILKTLADANLGITNDDL